MLKNPALRQFWFSTGSISGFGVTAFSLADAEDLLRKYGLAESGLAQIPGVIEDIDLQTLDAKHVRLNMGPVNFRGVWYPIGNMTAPYERQ